MRLYRKHEEELYTTNDIDDYKNKITPAQSSRLIKHCNRHKIYPCICAWYDDMEDFYQDWIYDNEIFNSKEDADERYEHGCEEGEFLMFDNGEIVRLVI